jgi:hemerythrin superfamily protein
MARADVDKPAKSADLIADAVDLLTRDHRLVEELFTAFAAATPQQLDPLARRACKLLRIHAQIEDELFYPIARRALREDELIDAAEREHAEARQAIALVESLTSESAEFKPAIEALAQTVARHVVEEESELFPRLRSANVNLVALGIALAERRDTLLDTLGLHSDDEEGAANQREVQQPAARPPRDTGAERGA